MALSTIKMRSSTSQLGHPGSDGVRPVARPGFSLPELLVVLFVVSLLVYVAVPRIEVVRFKMDGAARGSVAALVAAQRLAVKRQHHVVVVFDTANRRLLIHQDRNNDGLQNEGEPVRTWPFESGVVFGRGQAPALGSDTDAVGFTEQQNGLPALRFIRNGSASEEGTFYLTSTRSAQEASAQEASAQGAQFPRDARAVRVDRATGRVVWFRYDSSGWVEKF